MKFKLIESTLNEGKNIERTWEQYKDKIKKYLQQDNHFVDIDTLTKNTFNLLIKMDPTQKGDTTTGDYGIWLLNRYLDGDLDSYDCRCEEEAMYNDISLPTVTELLTKFTKVKSSLKQKDINQYKCISDLEDALNNVEFSPRQQERQLRNSLKEASLEFKDKQWSVWIPHTYAASCTLGKGTRWCTAYSNDSEYYDDYSRRGDLYIVINNSNPSEKYQFHFETGSFMDANDLSVDIWKVLDTDDELYEFLHKRFPEQVNKENKWLEINSGYMVESLTEEQLLSAVNIIIHGGARYFFERISSMDDLEEKHFSVRKITIDDVDYATVEAGDFEFFTHLQMVACSYVTTISARSFEDMKSLEEAYFGSCEHIGDSAFKNCEKLSEVNIMNCRVIRQYAFYNCRSLNYVYIPIVEHLGTYAFSYCPLKTATVNRDIWEQHLQDEEDEVDSQLKWSGIDYQNIDIEWEDGNSLPQF